MIFFHDKHVVNTTLSRQFTILLILAILVTTVFGTGIFYSESKKLLEKEKKERIKRTAHLIIFIWKKEIRNFKKDIRHITSNLDNNRGQKESTSWEGHYFKNLFKEKKQYLEFKVYNSERGVTEKYFHYRKTQNELKKVKSYQHNLI